MPDREVPLARLAAAVTGSVVGDPDVRVTGLTTDSRLVGPGEAFLCVRGLTVDGHDFVAAAVAAGAAAVVAERPVDVAVPVLRVESVRAVAGPLAAEFFDHPSRSMTVVGVTGTNGKTTVTHLIAAAAGAAGLVSDVSGTLSGPRTTPEAVEVQRTLAGARDAGVDLVAMEVSSHALDQRRVDGTRFAVAVFTNLTPEHLDYHASMEEYEAAKARLFEPSMSDHAVVNVDDMAGRRIASGASIPCVEVSPAAVTDVAATAVSTTFSWRGSQLRVPLGGAFMVEDALLAAEAAVVAGVDQLDVARGLATVGPVPGRFEVVPGGADAPLVIVDYAHTPDALSTTLGSARAVAAGRLTVVFGCGGDRDAFKRPLMGAIAARGADRVIVTNDNPRTEDPAAIAAQILDGVDPTARAHVEITLDRRDAIANAVSASGPGDVVVVAGKGHETTQETDGVHEPFDDRAVVREILGVGGRRR